MPGAGCADMAAAGSDGRRGVRISRRFGAGMGDAILAVCVRYESVLVLGVLVVVGIDVMCRTCSGRCMGSDMTRSHASKCQSARQLSDCRRLDDSSAESIQILCQRGSRENGTKTTASVSSLVGIDC